MSAELIIASLLADASIAALVGDNIALGELPQDDKTKRVKLPGLIYQIVSATPQPNVAESSLVRTRIQINPLAMSIDELIAIHEAVKAECEFQHSQTIAGYSVVSVRRDIIGKYDRDPASGAWTRPVDYILLHYEL